MIILLALVGLVACTLISTTGGEQIEHLANNEANLIRTSQGYALNSAGLAKSGFETISVNSDLAVLWSSNCQVATLTRQQLNEYPEFVQLWSNEVSRFDWLASNELKQTGSQFELDQDHKSSIGTISTTSINSGSLHVSRLSYGGQLNIASNRREPRVSVRGKHLSIKLDETSQWLWAPNMPENVMKVFSTSNVVAFVYTSGEVQMKPTACLEFEERQLVELLESYWHHRQAASERNQMWKDTRTLSKKQQKEDRRRGKELKKEAKSQAKEQWKREKYFVKDLKRHDEELKQEELRQKTELAKLVTVGADKQSQASAARHNWPQFGHHFPFGPIHGPFGQNFPFD